LDYFGIFNSAKVPSFLQGETINVLISAGADVRHVVRGTRGHLGAPGGTRGQDMARDGIMEGSVGTGWVVIHNI